MQADTLPQTKTGFDCPYCAEPLDRHAMECTKCDWVRPIAKPAEFRPPRNPRDVAAAVLSVVPGAGHFFKGYRLAAVLLLFVGVPVIGMMAFAFTMFIFGWTLIPAYWIVVAADAYLRRDLNLSLPKPRHA